jgi:hypothetical protein
MTTTFTRSTVENFADQVAVYDSDEQLELFCYHNCANTDSDTLKNCRGVIFHKDELIVQSFPFTEEYNVNDCEILKDKLASVFDKCSVYNSYEGALLRVFYFEDKWYLSTHKKLDAFKSKWSCRQSFGELFMEALCYELDKNQKLKDKIDVNESLFTQFCSNLNHNYQYMFLVCNNKENRIVCDSVSEPTLYHVGTFINGVVNTAEDIGITRPTKLMFSSVSELCNYVKGINYKKYQGVIVFGPENKQYKVLHSEYQKYYNVRGNESSVRFRYLQVRTDKEVVKKLKELYPEKVVEFEMMETTINSIISGIYTAYVNRFIKKQYVSVSKDEFNVVRECHSWHLSDRVNNKISLQKVSEIFNQQSPVNINRMVKTRKSV